MVMAMGMAMAIVMTMVMAIMIMTAMVMMIAMVTVMIVMVMVIVMVIQGETCTGFPVLPFFSFDGKHVFTSKLLYFFPAILNVIVKLTDAQSNSAS